jgi:nitrate/nitrite-specific signal transduction histidine kinase
MISILSKKQNYKNELNRYYLYISRVVINIQKTKRNVFSLRAFTYTYLIYELLRSIFTIYYWVPYLLLERERGERSRILK